MPSPPLLPPVAPPVRLHITWQLVAGWLTVALGAITAVTPVLPHEWDVAVPWLRPALGVASVLIAAVLRAPQSPTEAARLAQIRAASIPPTTPAAETPAAVERARLRTMVDEPMDQEAPTRPGSN